jgi:uncharacterized protein YukE
MSALDVLAELAGIGKPDGDPEAVLAAARRLAAAADGYDRVAAGLGRTAGQGLGGWTGNAATAFAALLTALRHEATAAADALRQAAGAMTAYAHKLDAAQASWTSARDQALQARMNPLTELVDADARRALAQAEQADADARIAAAQLAAEMDALAGRAAPLPDGVQQPKQSDRRLGGWLIDWFDHSRRNPIAAQFVLYKEFFGGVGSALKGYWDLGVIGAKLSPHYAAINPADYAKNAATVGGMLAGLAKLSTVYAVINPRDYLKSQQQFAISLLGLDTLRTGNLPRWAGQQAPDAILAGATGGGAAATAGMRAARRAARGAFSDALRVQPRIVSHVNETARLTGGTPVGQEHWIKTEASLTSKIYRDMRVEGISAEEAAAEIHDILRHTITHPTDTAADQAEAALGQFSDYGYKVVKAPNAWIEGNPYKGINVTLETRDGFRFEVQFHTPESYEVKTVTHPLYDILRDPEKPLEARQRAYDESVQRSAVLAHPPGIERIGTPKIYRRPA